MIREALRKLLGLVPVVDLHGLRVPAAIEQTERFLYDARERGEEKVRIVYGKGRHSPGGSGVLRTVIPDWLDAHRGDLVLRYERQIDPSGEDGGVLVWVRVDSEGTLP